MLKFNLLPISGWGGRRWLLFINWYACCNGKDSLYEIRVGMAGTPSGPFFDQVVDGTYNATFF